MERPDIEQIQASLNTLKSILPSEESLLNNMQHHQQLIDYVLLLEKKLDDLAEYFHETVEREVLKG